MADWQGQRDRQRAYGRGYIAGARKAWPLHLPPSPPQAEVAALITALENLTQVAHEIQQTCSICDDADPWAIQLRPLIDASDAALVRVKNWVLNSVAPAAGTRADNEVTN